MNEKAKTAPLPFPFGEAAPTENPTIIKCPVCEASDFEARQNQYETFRVCNKCGNKWSGGSVGAARPDFRDPLPPPGVPAPDDDLPVSQYTGAGFRLGGGYGGDDDY